MKISEIVKNVERIQAEYPDEYVQGIDGILKVINCIPDCWDENDALACETCRFLTGTMDDRIMPCKAYGTLFEHHIDKVVGHIETYLAKRGSNNGS